MGYEAFMKIDRDKIEVSDARLQKSYPTWYLVDASMSTFFISSRI